MRYAEFVYFHPFIQDLFHRAGESSPVRRLVREDVHYIKIVLSPNGQEHVGTIARCDLYLFSSDTAVLAVEVSFSATGIKLNDALKIRDAIRRIYPPFFIGDTLPEQFPLHVDFLDEHKISLSPGPCCDPAENSSTRAAGGTTPEEARACQEAQISRYRNFVEEKQQSPVAPWWEWLMAPLAPYREGAAPEYQQLGDERMFIMTYLHVDDTFKISNADWVRIGFVEQPDDWHDYPYAHNFLSGFEEQHCYDRFWRHLPRPDGDWRNTRYLFSEYAFSAAGAGGFFNEQIKNHFRRHYFHLMLLAVFQRAALLVFRQKLSQIALEAGENTVTFRSRMKAMHLDFIKFISTYLVPEISGQIQPMEMYKIARKQMEIESLYASTLQDIQTVSSYLDDRYRDSMSKTANKFTKYLYVMTPLGTGLALFAASISWHNAMERPECSATSCIAANPSVALLFLLSLVGLLITATFGYLYRGEVVSWVKKRCTQLGEKST